jgi:hypothetical protein
MPTHARWTQANDNLHVATISGTECHILRDERGRYAVYVGGRLAATRTTMDRARNSASWYATHPNDVASRRSVRTLDLTTLSQIAATPRLSSRTFGVEIEMSGCATYASALTAAITAAGVAAHHESYNHTTRPHWKLVPDGTVSFGELVSPILQGEDGLRQLAVVSSVLSQHRARVSRSCGLHVHLGARDLSPRQIAAVVINYARAESLIDTLLAPSRRRGQNSYCTSIRSSYAVAEITDLYTTPGTTITLEYLSRAFHSRYTNVNLDSLTRHGTIEFRQHHGTVEAEKITAWVRLLDHLASYSAQGNLLPMFAADTDDRTHSESDLRLFLAQIGLPLDVQDYLVTRGVRYGTIQRTPTTITTTTTTRVDVAA